MKKILHLFVLLLSLSYYAQSPVNISIEWQDNKKLIFDTYNLSIPHFQFANLNFNEADRTLFFNFKLQSTRQIAEKSLLISNIVYENITINELGDLNLDKIPTQISGKLSSGKARNINYIFFSFSPIIKSSTGYKKVKSLTFEYTFANSNEIQNQTNSSNSIQNSVLSSGDWYRFYIEKSGVYRISKGFLNQLGFNTNVNPQNIKIYGNGGKMIPLLNNIEYPTDLVENAIQFIGEEDGIFNNEDFILFYAEGLDQWNEESRTHLNLYDSKSYYYVTSQGGSGKRISQLQQTQEIASTIFTNFDDYQFYEKDLNNIGRIGRVWYGEQLSSQNTKTFDFNFPNIDTTAPISVTVTSAAVSFGSSSLKVKVGSQESTSNFSAITTNGSTLFSSANTSLSSNAVENLTVELTYNNNGIPSARGFIDYIIVRGKRSLRGFGKQFTFQNQNAATTLGIGEYQLTNASAISQVWDITSIYDVKRIENTSGASFNFKTNLGEARKYIAIDPTDYFTPSRESQSKVINQNLKGTIFNNSQGQFQDIDYIIVTPLNLVSEAERLAQFHRNYSQLNVKVITLDKIYQEFSSGKQDIGAIRNMVKYVYENASTPEKIIKYLNLFGDTSFDYKNRIPNNTNIVPIFHSLNSNNLLSSTMSDDFYGMFDPNEGRMTSGADGLDLAVGRMLVSNLTEAREMVDKVIDYHDIKSYGRWRNVFSLVSDDVDENWEGVIQQQLDNLGNTISVQNPFVNVMKYHSDSYVQEASAGGQRYPKLKLEMRNAIEQGSLVFNYFGHGGEDQLASERIFEKTDAQNLNNQFRYPLFITVTCEFTRFDNPFRPTAGEYTYWNPKGGAISLVTTTRQIGVQTGQDINNFFSSYLYGFNSNEEISIAEALRRAKNDYNTSVLMVFYVGDPAIVLPIPKPKIVLTQINDTPIESSTFIFNALSRVKLSGEVRNLNGDALLSDYNGDIAIQIFDKSINRSTLANDGTTNGTSLIILNFQTLGETIFRGNATVTNGLFEFEFIVPRDITIPVGNGRISFYAKTQQPNIQDQSGYENTIKIGGINANAPEDNIGPTARLFMNDETFISGGVTDENPIFLAFLEDENGINTASGIGHDIVAILDADENNPFVLNDYYETELDNYQKGKVRFPFFNLAPGLHTITFRAWDVYNNPISAEIQFIVIGEDTLSLTNVLNYPNPFVNYTQFWFSHNHPFEPLDVQVQIFTITGKVIKTINQVINTEGFLSREISWDGKDDFGDKIGKGVYIYKLTVKSSLTNKTSEKIEKLVIL